MLRVRVERQKHSDRCSYALWWESVIFHHPELLNYDSQSNAVRKMCSCDGPEYGEAIEPLPRQIRRRIRRRRRTV